LNPRTGDLHYRSFRYRPIKEIGSSLSPSSHLLRSSLQQSQLDRHPGMALRQQRRVQPVRSRSSPVENASGGQKKAANTYGAHPPTGVCLLPDPSDQIAVAGHIVHQKAPGTIHVSIGSRPSDRTDFVPNSTPLAVFTGPPRIETTKHSYVTRVSRDSLKPDATSPGGRPNRAKRRPHRRQ
jgi:hypothetical protein